MTSDHQVVHLGLAFREQLTSRPILTLLKMA